MNQIEMNKIAMSVIQNQSTDVAVKLKKVLNEDLDERIKEMPGSTIHYIHNMAMFKLLLGINCFFKNT